MNNLPDKDITEIIISCAFKVHNKQGPGFLEKVYENAMLIELKQAGLTVKQQMPLSVYYKNIAVGEYFAYLFVENKIICGLKSVKQISQVHEVQLVNYLTANRIKTGLLFNFGNSVTFKRKFRKSINNKFNPVNPVNLKYRDVQMPQVHDCMDAGGRATHGAIAEDAQERLV